jgi:DMSO/TMAO reductase YedYZ molybdopterin-dependent catalytic subunit
VRVVVPGYIGARSVKWVNAITVQETPSRNYFQVIAYRILAADSDLDTVSPDDGLSLSAVALSCDILVPDDGAVVPAGALNTLEYAFAGNGVGIARVEVSLDEGSHLAPGQTGACVQQVGMAALVARRADPTWSTNHHRSCMGCQRSHAARIGRLALESKGVRQQLLGLGVPRYSATGHPEVPTMTSASAAASPARVSVPRRGRRTHRTAGGRTRRAGY